MSRVARVAVLMLALAGAGESVRAQSPEEMFDRGNAAYEQGRYEEAAEAYRTVLRYGIEDAVVEYNLGNAAFKLRRLGEAILHYERARKLDPTDPEILANLELAKSLTVDRVETPTVPSMVRAVRRVQERIGPDRQAWALLVLVWLTVGIVSWCSARTAGWNPWAGWTVSALALCAILAGSSWYVTVQRLDARAAAVVLAEAAEVLAGPSENNAPLFTVHEGLTLEVRSERQEWVQVSLPNGLTGWVPRDAIEPV